MASLYQPLHDLEPPLAQASTDCGHWALRLITLLPGTTGSTIVGKLDHSTLRDSRSQYEALSYVCGDPVLSCTVIVNDHPVAVTQNLAQSLHHLRHASRPRKLWIDALCIDQTDIQERSLQVRRMGSIYENASRVVVFLGIEAEHSHEAIRLLVLISQFAAGDHASVDALLNEDTVAMSWQALLQLFRRPWWGRAWIVQEYAVAGEVIFVCSTEEVDGQVFARALENLVDYRFKAIVPREHEYLIRHVASTPIHHLWSTRGRYQDITDRNGLHVLEVLYKFRGSQCSDPRDKVFSIFSLIRQDSLLAPDYTKSTAQVYKDVVKAAIQASGTLEILAHHNRSSIPKLDLPTWCPDWTIMRGKRILLWPNGYNAAGASIRAQADISNNTLTLRGIELDRIKYAKHFESGDFKSKTYIHAQLHEFTQLACQEPFPETSTVHRLDTIYRTLVADRIRPGGPQQGAVALDAGQSHRFWHAWSKQPDESKLTKDNRDAKYYAEALYSALCGRSVLLTDSGRVGLVDGPFQVGDRIYVFSGRQVPFCIRSNFQSGDQNYELVGECYLYGFMDGEAMNGVNDEQSLQQVTLV